MEPNVKDAKTWCGDAVSQATCDTVLTLEQRSHPGKVAMKVTQDRTASYLMPKTSFSLIQAFTLDCATFQHRELRRRVRSQEDEVGVGRWDERFSLQEYPAGTEPELGGSVKSAVDSACPATRPVGCSYSRIGPSIHSAPPCLGPLVDFTIKSPADFSRRALSQKLPLSPYNSAFKMLTSIQHL
ncbi:hypothetical protein CIRG_01851 [Coccidioides immitis RMSCC 2394]|uniref:Uncharacterized protein n=1 Tax=Coccidioides immitis RMSCC 2394 TaxID=404692 RepID=A0A0J6Y4Y9_COCIT|nr:hypothetical protein CIRG_01851 [Coccidioides immitis RMSCC 2394]